MMHDLDAVRSEYVTTEYSLPELGRKHSISLHTLQKRCRKEGWVALRQQYKNDALAIAMETAVAEEADRLGRIISAAQSMSRVIEDVFADKDQFHRHLVTDTYISEDGGKEIQTTEKTYKKVDSRAIRDLTSALKDMTYVLRNLHSLPTQAEAEAQRIAAERLKLEQRKVENAEAAEKTDKKVTVVLADGWEEYAK